MNARLAYAALFTVVLPALLMAWAIRLDAVLTLPAYGSLASGAAVALAGVALMAMATRDLWVHGGGLPASPFPPQRIVARGVYGIVAHPIYLGAVLVAVGVSLATRSAAGLWIVSPALALSAIAFVVGFERDSTFRRYGVLPEPRLRLPGETDAPPSAFERAAVYVKVFLPWLVLFEAIEYLGVPPDARSAYFEWDRSLPVIPWTEAIYAATYPFALLAPLAAVRGRDLRRFALGGLLATAIIIPLYLLIPLVAEAKPVPGEGFWQALMALERQHDQPVTAFPSFHVVWACLAAILYASRWPRLRWFWWMFAAAQAASCVTTGMHAASDIIAGSGVCALVVWHEAIWRRLCDAAERVANSWRETTIGPVRLMSHGIYAGAGAAIGLGIAGALAGGENAFALAVMTLAAVFGAALWAQLVEGSPQLLRPYGYFGSVVMVSVLAIVASVAGLDSWLLFVSFGAGSCFTYAFGRMRCLVQGCCHGRATSLFLGIRHQHPMSRVVRLSALGGVPVHPTALYSALWMILVGLALIRLWAIAAPLQFIAGTYFVLVGLGRFVEEHFRGEPQTSVIAGLRLYQWLAIAFVIGGAVLMTLGPDAAPPVPAFDAHILSIAVVVGAMCYVAYGVDFSGIEPEVRAAEMRTQTVVPPMQLRRVGVLVALLVASFACAMVLDPIAQDAEYHDFADQRLLLGVPNLFDVASNIAFVIVGALGIALCAGPRRPPQVASWRVFFVGIVLTGFGSAWYHLAPSDATLVWDRLPMTLAFTALLVAVVAEHAGEGLERLLLAPALAVGVMSVLWWRWSGDLRFYFWVQFAPLLCILLVLALFPARHTHRRFILYGLGLYGLAKVTEMEDKSIFALTAGIVSGHTLKHLLAAGAILALLVMLRKRVATR